MTIPFEIYGSSVRLPSSLCLYREHTCLYPVGGWEGRLGTAPMDPFGPVYSKGSTYRVGPEQVELWSFSTLIVSRFDFLLFGKNMTLTYM